MGWILIYNQNFILYNTGMNTIPIKHLPEGQPAVVGEDIIVKCPEDFMRPLFTVPDTEIPMVVVSVIGKWTEERAELFPAPLDSQHKHPEFEVQPLVLRMI